MDVAAATYWLGWVRLIQLIAVFLVAIGVVAEFAGEWISRPLDVYKRQDVGLQGLFIVIVLILCGSAGWLLLSRP